MSSWGQSQWGQSQYGQGADAAAPVVTPIDPLANATGIAKDAPASFKITDDVTVVLAAILVYVRGVLIFSGGAFVEGWGQSTFAANSENGYTFTLTPDRLFWWRRLEVVTLRVKAEDGVGSTVDTSYSFTASDKLFRTSIYSMIVRSLRTMDERQ